MPSANAMQKSSAIKAVLANATGELHSLYNIVYHIQSVITIIEIKHLQLFLTLNGIYK